MDLGFISVNLSLYSRLGSVFVFSSLVAGLVAASYPMCSRVEHSICGNFDLHGLLNDYPKDKEMNQ